MEHRKRLRHFDLPGQAHELTFSCQGRRPLLDHDPIREILAASIDSARIRHGFELWGFVFMPEHVHLLILPNRECSGIADMLKSIKQSCSRRAVRWLRDHDPELARSIEVTRPSGKRERRFWLQGGGYDRNLRTAGAVRDCLHYIHGNPVRRGLVKSAADWYWSSAAWYEHGRACPVTPDPSLPSIRRY